jgi:hypothetical protein
MAHSTDDDEGTIPLLAQRFGGDAPAANFFLRESTSGTTNGRLARMMRFEAGPNV